MGGEDKNVRSLGLCRPKGLEESDGAIFLGDTLVVDSVTESKLSYVGRVVDAYRRPLECVQKARRGCVNLVR